MSYPSQLGYHDPRGQQNDRKNVYNSQNPSSHPYFTQIDNTTSLNSSQVQSGSFPSDWTSHAHTAYTNESRANYDSGTWRSNSQHVRNTYSGYVGSATQETGVAAHSQNYFNGGQHAHDESNITGRDAEALSNLAYVSGLETNQTRSGSSQEYGNVARAQTRTRSPTTDRSRHISSLPTTSRTMQNQPSTSTNMDQQLAMKAAAALAGAVGRKYGPTQQTDTATSRLSAAPTPQVHNASVRRTASPQVNNSGHSCSHQNATTMNDLYPQRYGSSQHEAYSNRNNNNSGTYYQNSPGHVQPNSTIRMNEKQSTSNKKPTQQHSSIQQRPVRDNANIANLVSAAQAMDTMTVHDRTGGQEPVASFVNPSQVFNPHRREQERRRALADSAEMDAKRRAEEEEAVRRAQAAAKEAAERSQQETQQSESTKPSKRKRKTKKVTTEETQTEREKIAAEMEAMMLKMKSMRSKDPSLFQKLFETMRDESVSENSGPQLSQSQNGHKLSPLPATSTTDQGAINISQSKSLNNHPVAATEKETEKRGAEKETNGEHTHLNGYKVVVENNHEGLPDLGRFPAGRRVRTKGSNKEKVNPQQGTSGVSTLQGRDAQDGLRKEPQAVANVNVAALNTEAATMPSYSSRVAQGTPGPVSNPAISSSRQSIPVSAQAMASPVRTSGVVLPPPPPPLPPPLDPSTVHLANGASSQTNGAHPTPIQPKSRPSKSGPPLGLKEAAARKRDFADLIDLTELDDENYVVPSKHPRLDESEGTTGFDGEMNTDSFEGWKRPAQIKDQSSGWTVKHPSFMQLASAEPLTFDTQPDRSQPVEQQNVLGQAATQKMILAKSLNKTDATTKRYYNPKTVARDILIASGRHPSERPLNVHLAGLIGRYIEIDSDVSTFEWNEIDPGGPPAPKVDYVDVPASKPRFKIGERVRRGPRGPRPTVIDTTRQPEEERRRESAALSDQSTSPHSPSTQPQSLVREPSKWRRSLLASEENATPATQDPTRAVTLPQSTQPALQQLHQSALKPPMSDPETPTVRKRGRPPGSKNKYPSLSQMRDQAARLRVEIPSTPSTPAAPENRFKCRWKECGIVLHNLDTLRKHIGKVHQPTAEIIRQDGFTCWWKACKFLKQFDDGTIRTTKLFRHWEDWLQHVDEDHIKPLAFRWGDGPSTQHTDPRTIDQDRTRYLSDAAHRLVTPDYTTSSSTAAPSDVLNLTRTVPRFVPRSQISQQERADEKSFPDYCKAHGIPKSSRQASEEVVRALRRRKELLGGAGIDKGGCTLVTQAMREGFVSAPGIRRVVPNTY